MSKIAVADAREFAALLNAGADQAEAAGATEFDLTEAAEAKYAAAKAELQTAIDAAKSP
jgi:hypothetical protein